MPISPKLLRAGVKIIDKVTKSFGLQAETYYRRHVSSDGAGGKVYDPPEDEDAITLLAIVEDRQEEVRTFAGELSQSRTHITYLDLLAVFAATGGNGIKEQDMISLQNGETGQILAIAGFMDAGNGQLIPTEVYLG